MKLSKFIFVFLFLVFSSFAQVPDTSWTRTYGGTGTDAGCSVQQTLDGGYIIAGYTYSYGIEADIYLIKTDSLGDTLWMRTYGGDYEDYGFGVQQTADGGYIITGYTYSYGAGDRDVYLIKTDSFGDTLWTKTFGGAESDLGYSIRQTIGGGYIIVGVTQSYGAGSADAYLIKTDSLGDSLWAQTYGGTESDDGFSVQQTADGGYVVAGFTYSYGAGEWDIYLIKADSIGDTIWTKTFGGTESEFSYSVRQTIDGGYIIAGSTDSYDSGGGDVYLIKADSLGDTMWTRTFGGEEADLGYSVWQTMDGGYIVAGYTSSSGTRDVYLIQTDSLGDTLWTRTFGGDGSDEGWSVQQTADSGYIVSGGTNSYGADYDIYLLKIGIYFGITVTSPIGGEEWFVDNTYNITWSSDRASGGVKIEYSLNNGIDWAEIVTSTTDSGSYPWTVPNTISDSCLVKVSDTNGFWSDASDSVFSISIPSGVGKSQLPEAYSIYVKRIWIGNQITFSYALPENTGYLRFAIYNTAGLKIREKILRENPAGFYSGKINIDGVSKGIYFIRMEVGEGRFIQTNKFLLM